MNNQANSDKAEPSNGVKLEDLPVNEATTEQVKGGPGAGNGRGFD